MTFKTLCIFGTRPEAIKMAPVIKELKKLTHIENKVCVTGQHQQMLNSVLEHFDITPDFNLKVMTEVQTLSGLTAKILTGLDDVYKQYKPDLVLVHGDTTTTLTASLSAYYHHIPVAHIEAGLRTGDINSPWPEEINRKLTASLATLHFAPTESAKRNLLREGIPFDAIHVTGNTVIDALYEMRKKLDSDPIITQQLQKEFSYLSPQRKMILVTGHRRESFGKGFERICNALAIIARDHPDVDIVYPVHLNPNVQEPVKSLLGEIKNIHLITPVDYLPFVYFMRLAYLILTDSGGIQEEAPTLNVPVLIMRDTTERMEGVEAGCALLVGTDTENICANFINLVENENLYKKMSNVENPYGDGSTSQHIVEIIKDKIA
jgi:UDP-N-acetylglucosamine 2-epimerase (non-hydrolysing)